MEQNKTITALAIESVTSEVLSRTSNATTIVVNDIAAAGSDAAETKKDFVMSVCKLIASTLEVDFPEFVGGIIVSLAAKEYKPVEAVAKTIDMIVSEGFDLSHELLSHEQSVALFANGPLPEKEEFLKELVIACVLTLANDDESFVRKFVSERTEYGEFATDKLGPEPEEDEPEDDEVPAPIALFGMLLAMAAAAKD